MEKEKFDFDAYLKWCEEKHLVASESDVLEQYKAELAKVAQTGEKAVKTAKQKEVFDAIAKYLGVNVRYDSEYFDDLEKSLKAICFAMSMCCLMKDVRKSVDEVADAYGLGEKEDD
jgi:hypothetical protein